MRQRVDVGGGRESHPVEDISVVADHAMTIWQSIGAAYLGSSAAHFGWWLGGHDGASFAVGIIGAIYVTIATAERMSRHAR